MLCLHCKSESFSPKLVDIHQVLKGKEFDVATEMMVCNECGWFTATDDQADRLFELVLIEYYKEDYLKYFPKNV